MMPERQRLEPYADLIDGHGDPALARLVADLVTLYASPPPPAAVRGALAQLLQDRARQSNRRAAPHRPFSLARPSRRLGVAAALLPVVFVLAAAAAGRLPPILERAFRFDPSTERIVSADLGTDVRLAQTIDGVTVTVERVYADPIQIVVGYTVGGTRNSLFDALLRAADTRLTDARGTPFRHASLSWGTGVEDGPAGALAIFDGRSVTGTPKDVALRFEIAPLRPHRDQPPGDRSSLTSALTSPLQASPSPADQRFTFGFTVPFESGRSVEPNQSVSAGGTTATLVRAVTTPNGTRVYLKGVGPNAKVTLAVDGASYDLAPPWGGWACPWTPNDTFAYDASASLMDESGSWRLVVQAAEPPRDTEGAACPFVTGGPWTFDVLVP